MKTFRQFQEETQQLDEALPALIPAALKLGGMALTAYSGYSAAKNLAKGNYKQAGMDALGTIPGGKVFKGIRALGGAKNLAKAGSFVQSANRFNVTGMTPNAYAKGTDKLFDAAGNLLKGRNPLKANKPKKSEQPKRYGAVVSKTAFDTGKKYKQTVKS